MIRFDNPGALWLLTLILPLLLLYLLKRKRREILVPSTLLWKKAVEDARASTPFQKLRSSLLLLLQVLILVLLTAILSRPHFLQTSQSSMQWILAIDSSASMSSTDEKPDRFNIAKEKLLDALKEIPTNDEVMLMNFSSSTSIIQPFTRNHSIVRTKLVELHAEDVAGDWQQLAQILEPLYRQKPAPRILIASDFANFPENLKQELHFDPLYSGKSGENVAITRAALEPLPENPKNQALFYEIKNFGKEGCSIDVEIRLNSEVMDAYQARLEPSQAINRSAELIIEAPAEIKILVQPEDAFRLDNDFVLNVVPQEKIPLQLEAQNPFLERALGVLPSIKISPAGIRVAELKYGEEPNSQTGLYFISGSAESNAGRVVQWNQSHPALRFVDAGLWDFSHYSVLKPPPDADILMETPEGPVAYAQSSSGKRAIVIGFALEDSNIVMLAGFPVFLQNSIEWLASSPEDRLPVFTGGRYKMEGPIEESGRHGFVNFADAGESNIAPLKIQGRSSSGSDVIRGRTDLSVWFLILVIFIVILEWWAFHRRIEASLR